MFRRGLGMDDVRNVIEYGEVIIDYPDDKPYPSYVMLSFIKNSPMHVVFAFDEENQTGIIVTAYVPDPRLWTEDFKSRRTD